MRDSRWPVWFRQPCCCSRSRWSAASIVRTPRSEAQRGGWCRRRRRARWSVAERSEAVLALRRVTDAVSCARDSSLYVLPRSSIVYRRAVASPWSGRLSLDAQPNPLQSRITDARNLKRVLDRISGGWGVEMKRRPGRGPGVSCCCCVSSPVRQGTGGDRRDWRLEVAKLALLFFFWADAEFPLARLGWQSRSPPRLQHAS
jgi:hypothetical protein